MTFQNLFMFMNEHSFTHFTIFWSFIFAYIFFPPLGIVAHSEGGFMCIVVTNIPYLRVSFVIPFILVCIFSDMPHSPIVHSWITIWKLMIM